MQLITPADAAGRVTDALKGASDATGAGFDYLVRTAKRESSLNPAAQNPSSSARGLFQFIDSTWLEVLKEEGHKLGLGDAAASVEKTASGRYTVQDPARKAEILSLRDDPRASALIAGAFTKRNAAQLTSALGRAPTDGELYAAHFLGAKGASQLVALASSSPDASAAAAFPSQAASNRAIFFENGRARTASEVYDKLTAGATSTVSTPSFAAVKSRPVVIQMAKVEEPEPLYNNGVENDQATFHSLFKTGRRSPVNAYVQQAWSSFGDAGMAADVATAPRKVAETIAPAYAPQTAAVPSVPSTPAAAAAVDAVTTASTTKRRRTPAAGAAKTAAAIPTPPVTLARPETSAVAASAPLVERPSGFIAFLKSVFSPPANATPASANARTGAQ